MTAHDTRNAGSQTFFCTASNECSNEHNVAMLKDRNEFGLTRAPLPGVMDAVAGKLLAQVQQKPVTLSYNLLYDVVQTQILDNIPQNCRHHFQML